VKPMISFLTKEVLIEATGKEAIKYLLDLKSVAETFGKAAELDNAEILGQLIGKCFFGVDITGLKKSLEAYERALIVREIAEGLISTHDFANFIIVRVEEAGLLTTAIKYDVYIVSYEFGYTIEDNNLIKIKSNGLFPFYIGRFDKDDLNGIFRGKL